MMFIGPFPEEKISPWKFSAWVALAVVVLCSTGCAQFRDTVGCYEHTDLKLGYAHNFGDSKISGDGGGNHGNDRNHNAGWSGEAFSEDRIDLGATVRLAPGSCK